MSDVDIATSILIVLLIFVEAFVCVWPIHLWRRHMDNDLLVFTLLNMLGGVGVIISLLSVLIG